MLSLVLSAPHGLLHAAPAARCAGPRLSAPTATVTSWYDSGLRLAEPPPAATAPAPPTVTSWYDSGLRLAADAAPAPGSAAAPTGDDKLATLKAQGEVVVARRAELAAALRSVQLKAEGEAVVARRAAQTAMEPYLRLKAEGKEVVARRAALASEAAAGLKIAKLKSEGTQARPRPSSPPHARARRLLTSARALSPPPTSALTPPRRAFTRACLRRRSSRGGSPSSSSSGRRSQRRVRRCPPILRWARRLQHSSGPRASSEWRLNAWPTAFRWRVSALFASASAPALVCKSERGTASGGGIGRRRGTLPPALSRMPGWRLPLP